MNCHVLVLLSLLFGAGCWSQPQYQVINLAFDDSGNPFACRVVIPKDLPENAPLVIAYHGIGDTSESMARYSQLDELAARHQFLLVYPDAEGKLWNVPRSGVSGNNISKDIERFDLILQEVDRQYSIDVKRVYVVGMSHGATFVYWLISQRSAKIAAAVAHSGAPTSETNLGEGPTPVLLIVGQEDPVQEAMRVTAQEYETVGNPNEFILVPGLGHEWFASHNEAIWSFLSKTGKEH
ncbi:PHB depolymerase family esterase [Bremerella sp. JC770]|uniref:alpha/beta hydrolase family esterase n=1 Tax=Bremerella sp. JC770 TaxID=3232137 RepID=UPI003457C40C